MLSSNYGLLLASALTLIFLWMVHNFRKKSANYWPALGIPVAKGTNIVSAIMSKNFDVVTSETNVYNQLKGHKVGGIMELWNPVLMAIDLDLIKHIYIKDFDYFVNRRAFDVEKSDPHMHFSLFNLSGDYWRSLRSKMSPTFSTGKIKRLFAIFDSSCKKLVTALDSNVQNGKTEFEIRPFLQKLAMDVIASSAFGLKTNLFEDPPNTQFLHMGQRVQKMFSGLNILKFVLVSISPKMGELLRLKFFDAQADKFLSNVIIQSLQKRMETGERREDFLQIIMEARSGQIKTDDDDHNKNDIGDEQNQNSKWVQSQSTKNQLELTDDLIIAQSLGFILAGFDTVESFLSWGVYELALNQDVQQKLFEELQKSFDENDGQLSYDQVNSLDYLDRVVSETLRKYPPAVRTERKTGAPYKIPGTQITVPKDTVVILPIYPIHHDPDYWPSPEKFDPDRFTKENIASRHPCAYQPFGLGPRMCIANRFALAEGKAVMAHLVLNFKFEPCDRTVIPPKYANSTTLKHDDDLWLSITSRK